ncbi:MAG: hypothetical protein WC494_03755 [Candidatus Pacearchaeota archaeon]
MISEKEINAIKLFNEKAEKLFNLSFTKKLTNSGYSFKFNKDLGRLDGSIKGPDDEAIDAFITTLRFFIQDNEPSSQRNLAKIYSKKLVPKNLAKEFSNARKATNTFLDSKSIFTINGENVTNRKIFNVFVYGGISHSSYKKTYDSWNKNFLLFIPLKNEFVTIVSLVFNNILYIKNLNSELLDFLSKNEK